MTDPLRELVTDALGLMNRSFIDSGKPISIQCEFYHQFRKLWDRGIPVGMGLGHLLLKSIDGGLGIVRLGERGVENENLAAVIFEERGNEQYPRFWRVVYSDHRFSLQDALPGFAS